MAKRHDRFQALRHQYLEQVSINKNASSSSSSSNAVQKDEESEDIFRDHSQLKEAPYWDIETTDTCDNDISQDIVGKMDEDVEPIRISLDHSISKTSLVSKTFKIMKLVESVLDYNRNLSNVLEADDQVPFSEGSNFSKGEMAREFNSISNKHLLTSQAQQDILNLFYNTLGHVADLPVCLTTEGMTRLRKNLVGAPAEEGDDKITNLNVFSKLKNYTRKGSRYVDFHQCENDCCVYVGKLTSAFFCPNSTCKLPRFRPCSRSKCEGKGKHDCTHLISAMDGVPYKQLHYRLLIPLITDLINTEYFVAALHYQNECMYPGYENNYTDIMDGEVAKEHLESMDKNYKAWRMEKAANSNSIPINLLLSQFYDGGQLFKWTVCNFWGLFTSILNLPPTYRGKLGISTFLSAIYGGKHTTAEKFMFTDLYCEELRSLYVGFEYVGIKGQLFFIQARLILHSMDTKAIEPVFKMKSMTGSRYGCPYCRSAHGQNNSWTTFFSGNRQFLSWDHYLRFFGQSGKCCPRGFYSEDGDYFIDEGFQSSTEPIRAEELAKKCKNNMSFCQPCDTNPVHYDLIRDFLRDENTGYEWYHNESGFDFGDLSIYNNEGKFVDGLRKHLHYRHLDFRPRKEHSNITKEEHLDVAIKARNLNLNRRGDKLLFVDGFFDIWNFEQLPYSDIARNTTFPPEHAIEGVVKRCFEFVFNVYKERAPRKKVYKKKKKTDDETSSTKAATSSTKAAYFPIYRPSFHEKQAPYSGTKVDTNRCQAWLLCVLVPVGIPDRSDWILNVNWPGRMKMRQWKIFILVYWDFILTTLEGLNEWYRKFFQMVADKILKLLSFSVSKTSIVQLQKEMDEMICLWEGLFPESPPFALHQLMHLVSSIPLFGSQHSWSEFYGEQALGHLKSIKQKTNPGGLSYERYIMNRSVDRELNIMETFYSKAVNETNRNAPNSTVNVSFDSTQKVLSFKVMQFEIFNPESTHSSFRPEEIDIIINLCLQEVRKRYDHKENECVKESCLYRLVSSMNFQNRNRKIASYYTFLKDSLKNRDSSDFFEKDELSLAETLINLKAQFHSKALIYGLVFQSRGSKFREYAVGDNGIDWKEKSNYSSWCKFPLGESFRYGKINAFFQVHIGDKSVDGLLIASVTSHKHSRIAPKLVDIVYHAGSMDRSILFIALQEIYPTRISLCPMGYNHLPIQITRNRKKTILHPKFINVYSKLDKQLNYYYMFQMDVDKLSRMPEKRPFTIYISSSSIVYKCKTDSSKCKSDSTSTKLSFRSVGGDGKISLAPKKNYSVENHHPAHTNTDLKDPAEPHPDDIAQQSSSSASAPRTTSQRQCPNGDRHDTANPTLHSRTSRDSHDEMASKLSDYKKNYSVENHHPAHTNTDLKDPAEPHSDDFARQSSSSASAPRTTSQRQPRLLIDNNGKILIQPKNASSSNSVLPVGTEVSSISITAPKMSVKDTTNLFDFNNNSSLALQKQNLVVDICSKTSNTGVILNQHKSTPSSQSVKHPRRLLIDNTGKILIQPKNTISPIVAKVEANTEIVDLSNDVDETLVNASINDRTNSSSDNGSTIAALTSAVGCCKICGKSPPDCRLDYSGEVKSSSENVLYSFPWRKNSCAIDSVGSCLQMIFNNLTSKGKDVMEEYCPDLCDIFRKLSNGSITTVEAKKSLETLLVVRLRTDNQNTFQKFSNHEFHSVELAYQLFLIRPPSLTAVSFLAVHNAPSLFTTTFKVKPLCRNNCNTDRLVKQDSLDAFYMCIRADIKSSMTFSDLCIKDSRIGTAVECQECGRLCQKAEYSQVQGAVIISIRDQQTFGSKDTLSKPVPDQIQLGKTRYTLSGCIYGDDNHFISIVRDFSSNRMLFCDGATNNAQFMERPTITTFPGNVPFRKRLNTAFYVRSDCSIRNDEDG